MKGGAFLLFRSFHTESGLHPPFPFVDPPKMCVPGVAAGVFHLCSAALSCQKQDFKGPRVKIPGSPLTRLPRGASQPVGINLLRFKA